MTIAKGCGLAVVLLALVLGLAAYGGYSLYRSAKADHVSIEVEVDQWIASYNAQRFSECYARADGSLRTAMSEAAYTATLAKLFTDNGSLTLGSQTGFYINVYGGESKATCQWDATTVLRGEVEVVFLLTKGAAWGITGVIVRSARTP